MYHYFLKLIVNNHIANVIKVAIAVICCACPVNVSVAITSPLRVHDKFNVSFTACINQDHNLFINQISS
jgi:hypothetical protein